jgi:hypothetical protein
MDSRALNLGLLTSGADARPGARDANNLVRVNCRKPSLRHMEPEHLTSPPRGARFLAAGETAVMLRLHLYTLGRVLPAPPAVHEGRSRVEARGRAPLRPLGFLIR